MRYGDWIGDSFNPNRNRLNAEIMLGLESVLRMAEEHEGGKRNQSHGNLSRLRIYALLEKQTETDHFPEHLHNGGDEMIAPIVMADMFCGAGGTSTGAVEAIEALGFKAQLTAINHWPVAVATHEQNHPEARHLCASLDSLNPRQLFKRGELKLLWASPECTHHSVARGGAPINDQSRATAWCVTRWAEALLPDIILVENVPEFVTWGPVDRQGKALKSRKGDTFRAWVQSLKSLGYQFNHAILQASDYGDPTTRKRFFGYAVRGRRKIVWPRATHSSGGAGGLYPWVAARDIIDWDLPGQSIYERKRPLAKNTMKRIWEGLEKFGLKPTIISAGGPACAARPVDQPMGTVLTRDHRALVEPYLITMEHGGGVRSAARPMPTITCAKGGAIGMAQPFLVEMRGTSEKQISGSARDLNDPLGTITSGGRHHALIEPALLPQQSGGRLRSVGEPAPTVSTAGAIALIEPFLVQYYGTGHADSVDDPLASVTTKERHALVMPQVVIKGKRYLLDIRFRMLQPHELAAAQGFRSDYLFTGNKTEQVKQIGNAVPRHLARALVTAALSQDPDVSWLVEHFERKELVA